MLAVCPIGLIRRATKERCQAAFYIRIIYKNVFILTVYTFVCLGLDAPLFVVEHLSQAVGRHA